MNIVEKIENCMEIESIEDAKKEIVLLENYFNSKEYLDKLSPKVLELIEKAKEYKGLYNIINERTHFTVETGVACGPCSSFVGLSEICIEENGEKMYISAQFVDEVADEVAFLIHKGESSWNYYFGINEASDEEFETFSECEVLYLSTSDKEWIESEYAVLFLALLNNLKEGLMNYDEENLDSFALFNRFFYSRLWYCALFGDEEFQNIYDTISMY